MINYIFKKINSLNYNTMQRMITIKYPKQLLYCGTAHVKVTFLVTFVYILKMFTGMINHNR